MSRAQGRPMTSREVIAALLRRWYLMMFGAALSLGILYVAVHQPPVYWTQFEVVVLPPVEVGNPNNLKDASIGLTPMAGLMVSEFNQGHAARQLGSSATTLYGEGLRQASRVRLRNAGSQWRVVHPDPVIDVQVVDPDPEVVRTTAGVLTADLDEILKSRQSKAGVAPGLSMTLKSSPADPVIYQVGGSPARAAVSIGLLGATATSILVVLLDRWLLRRRRPA